MGFWWAAVPPQRWPNHAQWRKTLQENWHDVYGDRRQEIVFIGTGMDIAALRERLDTCLVDGGDVMDIEAWKTLRDPFPRWKRSEAA
jgi:hypothetical protein